MAECWSCAAERGDAPFCPTCGKIQPVGKATYFAALGLPRKMRLATPAIEKAFREASKKVHPDRFGQEASPIERKLALEQTTFINDAYRTLRDPTKRAEYLLHLEGVDIGQRTMNVALLGEMLELQEKIDIENRPVALEPLRKEMQHRVETVLATAASYLDDRVGSQQACAEALNELRYLSRVLERIDAQLEG